MNFRKFSSHMNNLLKELTVGAARQNDVCTKFEGEKKPHAE